MPSRRTAPRPTCRCSPSWPGGDDPQAGAPGPEPGVSQTCAAARPGLGPLHRLDRAPGAARGRMAHRRKHLPRVKIRAAADLIEWMKAEEMEIIERLQQGLGATSSCSWRRLPAGQVRAPGGVGACRGLSPGCSKGPDARRRHPSCGWVPAAGYPPQVGRRRTWSVRRSAAGAANAAMGLFQRPA